MGLSWEEMEEKGELEINGVKWVANPACDYRFDYFDIVRRGLEEKNIHSYYRELLRQDVWFLLYFAFCYGNRPEIANHPFWVKACREVDEGPQNRVMDLWGRFHGKSSIITQGKGVQKLLEKDGGCEARVVLFSFNQLAAQKLFRPIKFLFESSDFMKAHFPDILWQDPQKESPKWSEEQGIVLKRRGYYKESSLEPHGLIDSMPTGSHYTKAFYDDVETSELVRTPERMEYCKEMFDLSANLADGDDFEEWVVGTPYDHNGTIEYIRNKVNPKTGEPMYQVRLKPSVEPATFNGKPVFMSEDFCDRLKANKRTFAAQHLLNPTPQDALKLNPKYLIETFTPDIPKPLWKFMTVDPAGDKVGKDSWAIFVVGVVPFRDDLGASDLYILDAVIEPMEMQNALSTIVDMYARNGRIIKVGVEKVGMSTMELHVAAALRAKGKYISEESRNLVKLNPGGRTKEFRINSTLAWPLNNGKIHISGGVPICYRDRLREEMTKFPYWHDDGLDALSYVYDIIKEYRFSEDEADGEVKLDRWEQAYLKTKMTNETWMTA